MSTGWSTPRESGRPPGRWKRRRAAKKRRLAAMTRKRRIWRRVGLISTWFLGLFALFLVVAVGGLYTLADVPRPDDLPQPQAAIVYYADGTEMAKTGIQNRTTVPLSQVPASL